MWRELCENGLSGRTQQRFILKHLLFTICINNIASSFTRQFADDLKIYRVVRDSLDSS